jgi:hypothetical protein
MIRVTLEVLKMITHQLKYYCDDTLKEDDDVKWNLLLDLAFKDSEYVEFNLLFIKMKLPPEIECLAEDFIIKRKRKDKIFYSGSSYLYKLSEKMKEFIKSKRYIDWYNYYYEDISFLRGNHEIFVTCTHENYIVIEMSEDLRNELNNKGYNFNQDWPSRKPDRSFC